MLGASISRATGVLVATALISGLGAHHASSQEAAAQPQLADGGEQRLLLVQAIQRARSLHGQGSGSWDCDIGPNVVRILNEARNELGLQRFSGKGVRNRISNADIMDIAVFYKASLDAIEFNPDLCSPRAVREAGQFAAVELPTTGSVTDTQKPPAAQTGEASAEPATQKALPEASGTVASREIPPQDDQLASAPGTAPIAPQGVVSVTPKSLHNAQSEIPEPPVSIQKVTVSGYTGLEYSNIGIALKANIDCLDKAERDPTEALQQFLRTANLDGLLPTDDLFLVTGTKGQIDLIQANSGQNYSANALVSGAPENTAPAGDQEFISFLKYLQSDDGRAFKSTLDRNNYTLVLSKTQFNGRQIMSALPEQAIFTEACVDFASQLFRASDKYGTYYLMFSRIIDARYADKLEDSNISTVFSAKGIYSVALEGTSLLGKVDKITGKTDQLLMLDPTSDPFEILEQLSNTSSFSALSLIRL